MRSDINIIGNWILLLATIFNHIFYILEVKQEESSYNVLYIFKECYKNLIYVHSIFIYF